MTQLGHRDVSHAMLDGMMAQPALIAINGEREAHAERALVPWWSFSKTALATAALKLVAGGHCHLDQRIGSQPYKLRQLLQHRAGVPNYGALTSYHVAVRRGEKP